MWPTPSPSDEMKSVRVFNNNPTTNMTEGHHKLKDAGIWLSASSRKYETGSTTGLRGYQQWEKKNPAPKLNTVELGWDLKLPRRTNQMQHDCAIEQRWQDFLQSQGKVLASTKYPTKYWAWWWYHHAEGTVHSLWAALGLDIVHLVVSF